MKSTAQRISAMEGITSVSIHIGNSDIVGDFVYQDSEQIVDILSTIKKLDGVDKAVWSEEVFVLPLNQQNVRLPFHRLIEGVCLELFVNNDKNYIGLQQDSKVMVVDDDYDIAELVKMALQRNGFENVSAFEAFLALEEFRKNYNHYSLVISDIRMPGLNGFEFTEYINNIKPGIKIILMSAFDINDANLLSMKLKDNNNICGMIQKPISPKKLAKIVAGRI